MVFSVSYLVIYPNGTKRWYDNDATEIDFYRETSRHGYESWWDRSHLSFKHRLDGPAYTYNDGLKEWWYKGKFIDVKSQEEFEKWLKLRAFW